MKYVPKSLLIIILTSSLIFGGAIINFFVADSDGDNIILTWQSSSEQNVQQYEVLRGPDKDHLSTIAIVKAKGDNSTYTYIDENAYKTTDSFYSYGLVVVDRDGIRSNSMYTFVTHSGVSSVKRTWGSIKALFR